MHCPNGNTATLHFDDGISNGKGDHWDYKDCDGKVWYIWPNGTMTRPTKGIDMQNRGRPWNESDSRRYKQSLSKIAEVKQWRATEEAAGRPSGFDAYCRAHGLCFACRTVGLSWNEETQGFKVVGMGGDVELFEQCPVCGGTGKLPAS